MVYTTQWWFFFSTCIYWIICIDQPKTLTLLLKSKILDFKILSHVHVYRIEYVSYRQVPYRIRIDTAADRIVPALECCERRKASFEQNTAHTHSKNWCNSSTLWLYWNCVSSFDCLVLHVIDGFDSLPCYHWNALIECSRFYLNWLKHKK